MHANRCVEGKEPADAKLQTSATVLPHSPFDASGGQEQKLEAPGIFRCLRASGCEVVLDIRVQRDFVLVQESLVIGVNRSRTPRAW